jgi:lipopolysaccharide export system protein LptA
MSTEQQPYFNSNKNAGRRTAIIVVSVSALFCALLIALLFAIGKDTTQERKHVKSDDIIELLNTPISNLDSVSIDSEDLGVELPKGGWVQQTDSMGNLIQQYRCDSLDPNPPLLSDGWIEMANPEVELYLGNKRIVITGNTAAAKAPKRILERGSIDGDVQVKLYDLTTSDTLLEPVMELHTTKVSFDNLIGEIDCPDVVRIMSTNQLLVGQKLSVRFNDLEERIELVHIEHLDYILFTPESQNEPQRNNASPTQVADKTVESETISPTPASVTEEDEYYIVTFSDNVTVQQGATKISKLAHGDKLTIAFSNESNKPTAQTNNERQEHDMNLHQLAQTIPVTIVTAAIANTPPIAEDTVKITCDGGLTMVPLNDVEKLPSTPQDTRIELFAFGDEPATLVDSDSLMTANGSLLRFQLLEERVDLFGSPAELYKDNILTSSNHLWIAQNEGSGGAIGEGLMTSKTPNNSQTTLQWSEGVDLTFNDNSEGNEGSLSAIVCKGDIVLSDKGSNVYCQKLEIDFDNTIDGSSIPTLAVASGDVKAISESQTLWANTVEVTFIDGKIVTKDDSMFGGSHADTMHADGDVQILLEDGGRAFCDSLDGHITQDSASLTGNVVIAYERMLMNRGDSASLTLDRASGKGHWEGAGQALFLDEPLDVSPDRRIDRPQLSEDSPTSVSMRSNWEESMQLDQAFNKGAGAIDLKGNVSVLSQRTAQERSQMTGDDLRLEFSQIEKNRELKKVIAKNDAQIEHRTWDILFPDLPPVVYYIGGNHIEFDATSQEALAVGNGELVLRDPRKAKNEVHQSALAGRGTTRFTWDNKLKTTKLQGSLYRLEMSGNVEMVHKGLDGSIGMLTSETIHAIAIDPDLNNDSSSDGAELTMRGLDLQQIIANGRVYVATETRRVDCDNFEYNLNTGFAKLTAKNDSSVAIVTEGTSYPVRASSIVWNMDPAVDTITIRGLRGTNN